MGVTSSNKTISTDRIDCGGTLRVKLALTAAPDILSNPTDIVLALDRSGSMSGAPLESMKEGAKTFIDILAESTGGGGSGEIGAGSRIGVVSFAASATVNAPLITSVADLKDAVDALAAGGNTNHAAAFSAAKDLFDPASANAKVIVMFTDGNTTAGSPPAPVAAQARAQGIVIYCIGLIGTDGLDVAALNNWASDPDTTHVAVTPDAADLEELFAELAANISKSGATDIKILETIRPDFIITGVAAPEKGTATMLDARSLRWNIPELGVTASESAVLEFFIRHLGQSSGLLKVNESITYSDAEGNLVLFPDPEVEVDCGVEVYPEPCPVPVDLTVEGCADAVEVDLGQIGLESQGRIIQMDVTIKNVCPGRRVALAAILTEVGEGGQEYPRGMKTMTIPAHRSPGCRDVLVKCIRFVVPEDLDVSGGTQDAICNPRKFKARFLANSIDTDWRCCEAEITV